MAVEATREDRLRASKNALQSGNFAESQSLNKVLLDEDPTDAEALYVAAVTARYLEKFDQARDFLSRLHKVAPQYGRAWQEEGHLAVALGDKSGALSAFSKATRFNPALIVSWREAKNLFEQAGQLSQASLFKAQENRLSELPEPLLAVTNHIYEGRLVRAEEICRIFLRKNPRNVEGMRLLAKIGVEFGILDDAEFLLESAVVFEPDNIQLKIDYIDVLRRRQKFELAKNEAEKLYNHEPSNPLFQSQLAIESMQTGDYDQAFSLFNAVLEKLPNDYATHTSKGHALKTVGKSDEAVASYRKAVAIKPDHGDAYYSLANLKTYNFLDTEVENMREQLASQNLDFMDRVHLSFALGKALEDRAEYEESFVCYNEGNNLKRAQTQYSPDVMSKEMHKQHENFSREVFSDHSKSGFGATDPIFIVGLPRAGSTLLEQILASHSQIDGTLELPNILALAHRLKGKRAGQSRYPEILRSLTSEQLKEFGEQFINDTRIHRKNAPFFIDKMPNNFRHIGLIHLILPNAKIIDARRAPMDCCFSGFKQLFAEGQEFTYGLEAIGRYYTDYVKLMGHWENILPGKVLKIQHEDVLDDLENETRKMLDFIGLPFEESCLDFHKNERAVRTASSEQVRQPINRKGQNAWKPFEPWLQPLKQELAKLEA